MLGLPLDELSSYDWTWFLLGGVGDAPSAPFPLWDAKWSPATPLGIWEGCQRLCHFHGQGLHPLHRFFEGSFGYTVEAAVKGRRSHPLLSGSAVLRSSIHEFLASEAMHHLGISTTRALSLVVSGSDTSQRSWYRGHAGTELNATSVVLGIARADAK
mmetsp:Transcript_19918/g.20236  ORF Transcript_19918/g.20236 Transcript_19918/m.20236 type:complete len:157 (-) Transcript_19918:221-691(-)